MVEENGMSWLCKDIELLQVREGYHSFNGSVTGVWDRIEELYVAEVRGRLEKSRGVGSKGSYPRGRGKI